MDKLIVRGTEINVQWNLKRDDFLSLTDIAKIKDNDNPRYIIQNWLRNFECFPPRKFPPGNNSRISHAVSQQHTCTRVYIHALKCNTFNH